MGPLAALKQEAPDYDYDDTSGSVIVEDRGEDQLDGGPGDDVGGGEGHRLMRGRVQGPDGGAIPCAFGLLSVKTKGAYLAFRDILEVDGRTVDLQFCYFHFETAIMDKLAKKQCKQEMQFNPVFNRSLKLL